MTEPETTDAMAAIGIPGARERDDADPVRIWFHQCLVAEFSLPDALLRRITGEEPRIDEDGDSVSFARSGAALWRGGDDERVPGCWETVAVAPAGYFDPVE